MKSGFLVSFEGGEACGKSTQVVLFKEYLTKTGVDFVYVREPGGTDVGEKIRQILLHDKTNLNARTEFLLFSASRSKLIDDVVRPALESGKVVVMDRFYDSSFAYQGYAGQLKLDDIKTITDFAISNGEAVVPDLTFLLDISFEDGMKRKSANPDLANLDRMELKGKEYHDRVRAGYLEIAKKESNRIVVVDALQTREEIAKQIQTEFERRKEIKEEHSMSYRENYFKMLRNKRHEK